MNTNIIDFTIKNSTSCESYSIDSLNEDIIIEFARTVILIIII